MFSQSFSKYSSVCVYLTSITLINFLMIVQSKATVISDVNLIETHKHSQTEVIPSSKQIESPTVAQTITPESIKVVPQPNDILIPEKLESDSSDSQQKQPVTPKEEIDNPALKKQVLELYILNSISNSAKRYPWLINPTDNLNFSPETFNPIREKTYTNFDIKFAQEQPIVDKLTVANFRQPEQFYWILPDNRIVIETKGLQAGILYQGETTELENKLKLKLSQALWGMQSVIVLPQRFEDLIGEVDVSNFSIQTTVAELVTPEGVIAPPVTINNTNSNNSNTIKPISELVVTPKVGSASTRNPQGGGALFRNLDAKNAPQILQAFPTNNLKPLLEAEGLFKGAFIPQDVLAKTGFFWENPLTGEQSKFQPEITSTPGIKVAQGDKFDNLDLLNVLINPYLKQQQRDNYYFNSLFWVSLGQRQPKIVENIIDKQEDDSHRLYLSNPHNRTLLQYDSTEVKATYHNVFANPGISLSFNQGKVDKLQTANTTLSLLMGGIFASIQPPQLEQSLEEAKVKYNQQENLAALNSKATSQQRKEINQRLNRTLFLTNNTSSLEQVSGKFTFPSSITPKKSHLWQIRTGNHRRTVQFIQKESEWIEGDTYISKIRLSNDDFGPLTFIGLPIPLNQTSIQPVNRSSALEIKLINPDGEQFVQNFNSSDLTMVPMNIRAFDMASDRIELTQIGQLNHKFQIFNGSLSLPTVEALWSGSSGNWNYGINSGLWFNLNSASAFNVANNNAGKQEPGLGVYMNGLLNLISNDVKVNAEGKTQSVTTHVPTLRFHWNSAANSLNPSYLNLSYSMFHQNQKFNYSLTPGIIIIDDNSRLKESAFIQTNWGWNTGWNIKGTMEINDNFYYSLEGLKKLNPNWSVGSYFKNYRNTNNGFNSRVSDLSYGLIIQNNLSGNNSFWQSKLGISGNSFDAQFQGSLRF
ncbi:hypothetical protein IQ247_25095 [Plectonema cf. radiosum LEGE 06105]|uniref:Uncharacterized protein n=2 Tax=Plectonema TaxID=1183 RepID=A0A8J7FCF8_9CYAN|nr:hypothetical protein [Plectonema cf. radiosum LEGE 06105]